VLENRIVSILPYSREVSRSINKGTPALVSAADSEIGLKLAAGMREILGEDEMVDSSSGDNGDGSGGRRRRRRRNKGAPEMASGVER